MLLLIILTSFSTIQNSDTLYWCNEEKLTWEKFTYDSSNSRIGARIAPQITVTPRAIGEHFVLDVHAVLLKSMSLYNDTSKSLLEHEQIHFDIAELAARIVREFVSKQTIGAKNLDEVIHTASSLGRTFMKDTNEEFDNETFHGFLEAPQNQWRKRIDEQLKHFEAFSNECR